MDTQAIPAGPPHPEQDASDEAEPWPTAPDGEVERVRAELATGTGEYTVTLQQLRDTEDRLRQSQDRVQGLQEQLDQVRGQLWRDTERRDERAKLEADRARLLAEVEVLRVRAADADRLEREHRTARAEIDSLAGELQRTREHLGRVDPQAGDRSARELEALRAERDRLRGELQGVRDELESRATETARLARVVEELEALRAERDRLEVDHLAGSLLEEQLRTELGDVRRRLAEEAALREAAGGELTRSREEAIAGWEAERRALQSRDEELRAQLRDAERRLVEEEARAEAASRDWQERLDAAQARFERDRQALQEERDRLVREAETQAREREAAIEQSESAREEHARFQAEIARLAAEAEGAGGRADELAGRVQQLQDELDRQRSDRKAELRQHDLDLVAFGEEVRQIRLEADAIQAEAESLARERDDLAARHAEARDLADSAVRRNEELGEQIRTLRDELERQRRDHEAERQAPRRGPAEVGDGPDHGHAGVNGVGDEPPADATDRDDLHRRLVATREELRAAIERADRLEAEAKALRARSPLPGEDISVGPAGLGDDLEGDRRRVEELTEQLRQARGANEQFRSILNVFGLISLQEKEDAEP